MTAGAALLPAQDRPTIRVNVDMVVLSFQVQDSKNHYINGLKGYPAVRGAFHHKTSDVLWEECVGIERR